MKIQHYIARFFAWIAGAQVPVMEKKEIRGNGGKTQREIIGRWWN